MRGGYEGGFGTAAAGGGPAGGIGVALDVAVAGGFGTVVSGAGGVILLLLSFFTVVSVVVVDDFSFFTVVPVVDADDCSCFTVLSVASKFSKPFGGALGGFGNAHAGGALVFALS